MGHSVVVLLLAGGSGSRMASGVPKQYIRVKGKMIIEHCLDSILKCSEISHVQVVLDGGREEAKGFLRYLEEKAGALNITYGYSNAGESRAESIHNGLIDLSERYDDDTLVIIHDAARPMVSKELLLRSIGGIDGYDGVMPAIPVKDTLYYVSDDGDIVLLQRDKIKAGQSPEVFRLGPYIRCYEGLSKAELMKIRGTSEIGISNGLKVKIIDGEERNFKITTREDLARYENILQGEEE